MLRPNPSAKITNKILSKLLIYFQKEELEEMGLICDFPEKLPEKLPPGVFYAPKTSEFSYCIRLKINRKYQHFGFTNSVEEAVQKIKEIKMKNIKEKYQKFLNENQ